MGQILFAFTMRLCVSVRVSLVNRVERPQLPWHWRCVFYWPDSLRWVPCQHLLLYCHLALVSLSGLLQGYMPCLTSLLIVYALRVPHCPLIDPVHPERRGPAYTPFPLGYPRPTGLPPRRSVPLDSDWLFLPVPNLAGISTAWHAGLLPAPNGRSTEQHGVFGV
jgi:hypothetical protein